jgi:hypothetical protein
MNCVEQKIAYATSAVVKLQLTLLFVAGLFSGVSILLLIGLIVMLCVSPKVRAQGDVGYMNTVFFVFR